MHENLLALHHQRHAVHDLKENQELLKRGFTGMIMKFCQLLDELDFQDYTYLEVLQDQSLKFVPERGMKTEEEIKLATQEIRRWNGKLVELGKEIIELALRFVAMDRLGVLRNL